MVTKLKIFPGFHVQQERYLFKIKFENTLSFQNDDGIIYKFVKSNVLSFMIKKNMPSFNGFWMDEIFDDVWQKSIHGNSDCLIYI